MVKWDLLDASLKIRHADPLNLLELFLVPPHIIELVPAISYSFVDWDIILADPVGLLTLDTQ